MQLNLPDTLSALLCNGSVELAVLEDALGVFRGALDLNRTGSKEMPVRSNSVISLKVPASKNLLMTLQEKVLWGFGRQWLCTAHTERVRIITLFPPRAEYLHYLEFSNMFLIV